MALTTREQDFSERYNQLVTQADLAQTSAVRGCMVIKPYGFAIRENMQKNLDAMFKNTGIGDKKHQNAYFPLLIPKSFFSKEAKHVEGFATEAAIVTHYRLKRDAATNTIVVDPEAKLEEELIIRPTSETIIWNTYKDWVQSYRDLPILVNQRANVVRREMRTRLFLRTAEFLWQEGHTAHATADEAIYETKQMRQVYQDFFTNFLAISGVPGEKSENERFAGAENTYTIECMMQDGKALQACTSHFLGQNFGKAFDVTFVNKDNTQDHARATSWGASTRMMGGLIMSHSDDKWLVLPPAIAPIHVVIVPIWKNDEDKAVVAAYIEKLQEAIEAQSLHVASRYLSRGQWHHIPLVTRIDRDDQKSPGRKYNQYELQGVPLRIAVGPRDAANGTVEVFRRDTSTKESISIDEIAAYTAMTLQTMQAALLKKNEAMREANTVLVNTYDEFKQALNDGKFVLAHWDGTVETEETIKTETKATIRCIPADAIEEVGTCVCTGKPSSKRVLFAIAY